MQRAHLCPWLMYLHLFHVWIVREELKELSKDFDRSEDDLKSLQSGVGQIVGEVLRQLTEDKCKYFCVCVCVCVCVFVCVCAC